MKWWRSIMSESLPERISLGASDLQVSPLGIGTNSWGLSSRADPGKRATFEAILGSGVNFIDTAEVYRRGGSERTLGQFLPESRRQIILATKFFPFPWRLGRSRLIPALRASLARLNTPQVDLYMLHFPFPPVPLATWMRALAEAREAGLTRAVGISNCGPDQLRRAHALLAVAGLPLASDQVEYSLLTRRAERSGLLAECRRLNVALVAYRPLGYGLLTGKYRAENLPAVLHGRRITPAYLRRITPLLDLLRQTAGSHGKTPSQVALNWIICKGAIPIPGVKTPAQVAENAGAQGWRLETGEVAALDRVSLEVS
jgi:aryl-alcohol dehydrogenase-like predicted oxidoreductase